VVPNPPAQGRTEQDFLDPLSFPAQRWPPTSRFYTWRFCPFCHPRPRPCSLRKVRPYREFAIDGDNAARSAMAETGRGRKSLPQILSSMTRASAGCDELHALERAAAGFDPLLTRELRVTASANGGR